MPALYLPLSLSLSLCRPLPHSHVTCLALADGELSLKDNARNKFGAGGQTLTPRHTIDAILGLKNRNAQGQQQHHQQQQQLQPAQGQGQQQQQQQTEISDGKCQVPAITYATVYRFCYRNRFQLQRNQINKHNRKIILAFIFLRQGELFAPLPLLLFSTYNSPSHPAAPAAL